MQNLFKSVLRQYWWVGLSPLLLPIAVYINLAVGTPHLFGHNWIPWVASILVVLVIIGIAGFLLPGVVGSIDYSRKQPVADNPEKTPLLQRLKGAAAIRWLSILIGLLVGVGVLMLIYALWPTSAVPTAQPVEKHAAEVQPVQPPRTSVPKVVQESPPAASPAQPNWWEKLENTPLIGPRIVEEAAATTRPRVLSTVPTAQPTMRPPSLTPLMTRSYQVAHQPIELGSYPLPSKFSILPPSGSCVLMLAKDNKVLGKFCNHNEARAAPMNLQGPPQMIVMALNSLPGIVQVTVCPVEAPVTNGKPGDCS